MRLSTKCDYRNTSGTPRCGQGTTVPRRGQRRRPAGGNSCDTFLTAKHPPPTSLQPLAAAARRRRPLALWRRARRVRQARVRAPGGCRKARQKALVLPRSARAPAPQPRARKTCANLPTRSPRALPLLQLECPTVGYHTPRQREIGLSELRVGARGDVGRFGAVQVFQNCGIFLDMNK